MHLNLGQIIAGRYEIADRLGSGGMSVVYKAKDLKLDRFVTFKVLREEHLVNETFRKRFTVEARAVASLNHPNIVNVYDVGQEQDIHYIVMEFIDGVTLKDLIESKAPFNSVETLGVAIQIASALSHAHANGIIHRDIKPQNVLVTPAGTVKVTDFGIARSINAPADTLSGSSLGSVHYFSPEQARGAYVDNKSDLYSLGIVMFEMVTGTLPFDNEESVAVALMHVNDELPDLAELNPDVSKSVESIIRCLTEKPPELRYPSADKLLIDLRTAITKPNVEMGYTTGAASINARGGSGAKKEEGGTLFTTKRKVDIAAFGTAALLIVILFFTVILPQLSKHRTPGSDLVAIPALVDLTYDQAVARAEELGFFVEIVGERYVADLEAGIVLQQDYEANKDAEPGVTIGVVVSVDTSASMLPVPDLRNIELAVAEERVTDMPFNFTIEYEYSDNTAFGVVIRQMPLQNEMVESGTTIVLTVSKGVEPKMTIVPYVIGLPEAEAKLRIQERRLNVGSISTNYSNSYPQGIVMMQTVAGDKEVPENVNVGIVVSLGPPPATSSTPGPGSTAGPTNDPNGEDGPSVTDEQELELVLTPPIPDGTDNIELTIMKMANGVLVEIYRQQHSRFDFPMSIPIRGKGQVEYHMLINGVDVRTQIVDFANPTGDGDAD